MGSYEEKMQPYFALFSSICENTQNADVLFYVIAKFDGSCEEEHDLTTSQRPTQWLSHCVARERRACASVSGGGLRGGGCDSGNRIDL